MLGQNLNVVLFAVVSISALSLGYLSNGYYSIYWPWISPAAPPPPPLQVEGGRPTFWGSMERMEARLGSARSVIREAMSNPNVTVAHGHSDYYIPQGPIYNNPTAFHRSYRVMEEELKIYVYEEGEGPLFHNGPCKNIYSMEGVFMRLMESNTQFRTRDPNSAHLFFLPFSVAMIVHYLFDPLIRDKAVLDRTISDYVRIISHTYPFWNRSSGADHFMLSCHDWGPRSTWYVKELYYISIRVLCNANTSEYFNPMKDVSFPEINLPTGDITRLGRGLPVENKTILAFFAGAAHGKIRRVLLEEWKGKDEEVVVYEGTVPKGVSYEDMMEKSQFCLCPSGHEVASPRIAEAIYKECVPVLISQHYVLPFSDVLNWSTFSVTITVDEIPRLKEILAAIQKKEYERLVEGVRMVMRHFMVNDPPQRYDVFHLILHSIWLRRLNVQEHIQEVMRELEVVKQEMTCVVEENASVVQQSQA